MQVLVIDVGGSHVKVLATGQTKPRRFDSGPKLSAKKMVKEVTALTEDWKYEVVSIGYPSVVVHGRIVTEPHNLGTGWVGFAFPKAFGRPVKLINDAAMQALGSYDGGRMLFLGLGTGLGSAMIVDGALQPMEIAHMRFRKDHTFEQELGRAGLLRLGRKKWQRRVFQAVDNLRLALEPEDIVLGGGNVKKLDHLPEGAREGANSNAFIGGFRLWNSPEADQFAEAPKRLTRKR